MSLPKICLRSLFWTFRLVKWWRCKIGREIKSHSEVEPKNTSTTLLLADSKDIADSQKNDPKRLTWSVRCLIQCKLILSILTFPPWIATMCLQNSCSSFSDWWIFSFAFDYSRSRMPWERLVKSEYFFDVNLFRNKIGLTQNSQLNYSFALNCEILSRDPIFLEADTIFLGQASCALTLLTTNLSFADKAL